MVAFMPWKGYNFEDAIVVSEKVLKEDSLYFYTHRGVSPGGPRYKRGVEELTNDIPNVSAELTKDLE